MKLNQLWMIAIVCGLAFATTGIAAEKVDLKLDLKKGQSYPLLATIDSKVVQTMGGQQQTIDQSMAIYYTMKVTDVAADGTMDVTVTYDRVRMNMKNPAGNIEYDSDKTKPEETPMMARGFAGLVGSKLDLKITPKGKVTDVKGADELLKRMIDKMELQEPQKSMVETQLKQQFGPEAIRKSFEQMTAFYPEKPVAPGESWTQKVPLAMGFPILTETTYTLKEVKGDAVVIDMKGTVSTDPKQPMKMGPQQMVYDLKGEQTGTITLDKSSGWIQTGKAQQNLDGSVKLQGGGQDLEIPMKIQTDMAFGAPKKE